MRPSLEGAERRWRWNNGPSYGFSLVGRFKRCRAFTIGRLQWIGITLKGTGNSSRVSSRSNGANSQTPISTKLLANVRSSKAKSRRSTAVARMRWKRKSTIGWRSFTDGLLTQPGEGNALNPLRRRLLELAAKCGLRRVHDDTPRSSSVFGAVVSFDLTSFWYWLLE